MSADFDYEIIEDKHFLLSDKEISDAAEGIFEDRAYNYGNSGYTGTLAEKTEQGVTINRVNV